MLVKKIWIVSKAPWFAINRNEWISLSKMSGSANFPDGEHVEVRLTENAGSSTRAGDIFIEQLTDRQLTKNVVIRQNIAVATATWGWFVCDRVEVTAAWSNFVCDRVSTVDSAVWSGFICDIGASADSATWGDFVCDVAEGMYATLQTNDGVDIVTSEGKGIEVIVGGQVSATAAWSDFVCDRASTVDSAEWSEFVCDVIIDNWGALTDADGRRIQTSQGADILVES